MQKTWIIILIIITSGCHKASVQEEKKPPVSFGGRWFLVQTLTDPGNGSGTWQPVSTPGQYYIQFEETRKEISSNLFNYKTYSILTDSTIQFTDSLNNVNIRHYNIADNNLTLMGGCYEACGNKFVRLIIE